MAAPMQPGGLERNFEYDDFDGDGFFLGDACELEQRKEPFVFTPESKMTPQSTSKWSENGLCHNGPSVTSPSPRDVTVRLGPSREAFVPGSQTMTVDDFRTAVMRGNVQLVTKYLDQGFEVDTVLRSGWTGLLYAASCCDRDVMEELINRDADVNFHKDHYSCLMAVCSSGKADEETIIKCAELLLDHGSDVNAFDRYHMTSVMYSAREGRAELVKKLVERGAEVNRQDHRGYTALFWAASRGHPHVTSMLVRLGADVTIRTRGGQTASDVAASQGYHKICDLLDQLGRETNPSDETLAALAAVPLTQSPAIAPIPTKRYERYGELELFLTGLDCSHLIEVFKEQEISFSTLLRMNDDELIKAGISKLGERRKIVDAIHSVHKRDWKESSLHVNNQYSKQLTSGDVLSSLGNMSRHLDYIGASLQYIRGQVKERPEMMRQATDSNSLLKLQSYTEDSLTHTRRLYDELCQTQAHVHQMIGSGEYLPVDLITANNRKRSYYAPKIFLATLGLGLAVWKKEVLAEFGTKMVEKVQKFVGR